MTETTVRDAIERLIDKYEDAASCAVDNFERALWTEIVEDLRRV